MSETIIRVENLGKKYIIGHQQQESYTTLRDVISKQARSLFLGIQNPKSKIQNSSTEEFWALKDVSFEIKQGDRVGIIGRNGAGKSTLLKVLSRITEPTNGRIGIKGRVASLLEVGTGFHPELTGRENVYLNGAILGMSKTEIRRKFDEMVAFAEVEKFLDTPVKRYSSGMYVRLAFSVAAHLEPEVLIVDEVLAVGDAAFQKKCIGKMDQVASEGRTVLFVSHNMGTISALCDKVIYLSQGKIREAGVTDKIIRTYFAETLRNKNQALEELRLPGYGKQLKFTGIELVSENENLLFNQPIEYELKIMSDIDIEGLSIGSSFFGHDGACIGSLITNNFSVKAGKEIQLRLSVLNPTLAPGSYHVGFSVGFGQKQGTRTDLDIVIGKPSFDILPISNDSSIPALNWHSSWGSIIFKDINLATVNSSTRFSV